MITKNELRKKAKILRKSLDIQKISEQIVTKIFETESYKKAQHIMIFYPVGHEVNLLGLINDDSKIYYLPKVDGENMLVCPYKNGDALELSSFKTQEPISQPIGDTSILDVIFIPALLVDQSKNRLGYGGGFYDRFLSKQSPTTTKIVAIPSALTVERLPSDSFDEPIDLVITEQ